MKICEFCVAVATDLCFTCGKPLCSSCAPCTPADGLNTYCPDCFEDVLPNRQLGPDADEPHIEEMPNNKPPMELKKICDFNACSDGEGKQYPDCDGCHRNQPRLCPLNEQTKELLRDLLPEASMKKETVERIMEKVFVKAGSFMHTPIITLDKLQNILEAELPEDGGNEYNPDYVSHPVETFKEMSDNEIAIEVVRFIVDSLKDLLTKQSELIAKHTGTPKSFWMKRIMNYCGTKLKGAEDE